MVRAAGAAGDTRRAGLDGSDQSGPGGEEAEATPPGRSGTAASREGAGFIVTGAWFPVTKAVLWGGRRGLAVLGGASRFGGGVSRRFSPPPHSAAHVPHPLCRPPPMFIGRREGTAAHVTAAGGHSA